MLLYLLKLAHVYFIVNMDWVSEVCFHMDLIYLLIYLFVIFFKVIILCCDKMQRLCEELEYSELLDRCADLEDPFERMVGN